MLVQSAVTRRRDILHDYACLKLTRTGSIEERNAFEQLDKVHTSHKLF